MKYKETITEHIEVVENQARNGYGTWKKMILFINEATECHPENHLDHAISYVKKKSIYSRSNGRKKPSV